MWAAGASGRPKKGGNSTTFTASQMTQTYINHGKGHGTHWHQRKNVGKVVMYCFYLFLIGSEYQKKRWLIIFKGSKYSAKTYYIQGQRTDPINPNAHPEDLKTLRLHKLASPAFFQILCSWKDYQLSPLPNVFHLHLAISFSHALALGINAQRLDSIQKPGQQLWVSLRGLTPNNHPQ